LIQFGQRLSATHVLQSAIGRSPIQPFTNPSRQIQSRDGRFCSDGLLNPIQNGFRKMLATSIHAPCITPSTPCVKYVLRSPPGERVGHSSPQQSWGVFWNILIKRYWKEEV
jgi:hypothetical protein